MLIWWCGMVESLVIYGSAFTSPPLNKVPISMTLICITVNHESEIAPAVCIKRINRKSIVCYKIKCIYLTQTNDVF